MKFWFPVTIFSAKKLTAAPGEKGKLGVWHRNGFSQATLRGRPLYTFIGDSKKAVATGEGIKSFGGTWHVIKTSATTKATSTTNSTPSTTTTTATTTTTPCLYPPCY